MRYIWDVLMLIVCDLWFDYNMVGVLSGEDDC
jgi:hypothetical protein